MAQQKRKLKALYERMVGKMTLFYLGRKRKAQRRRLRRPKR